MKKVNLSDLNKEIARLRANFHDIDHGLSIREEKTLAYLEQLASLLQKPYAVPEGWKLVPVVPTKAMLMEGYREASVYSPTAYRAMILAAPEAPNGN